MSNFNVKRAVWFIFVITGVFSMYGYVQNIIALADSATVDSLVIIRACGILVAPLGVILGYF